MKNFWIALRMFFLLMAITGIVYPILITVIAQLTMKTQANGNLLLIQGKPVGSLLIAQKFASEGYFWPRPSSGDYNPLPSGGSNLGPTSAALKKAIEERRSKIGKQDVPSELLYASGSGLDPHISPSTAYFQMERVSKARGLNPSVLKKIIDQNSERPLGIFGTTYVNVLQLNMALDAFQKK